MLQSDLKNRLRSLTRVTTFKFQDALRLKNRHRSRTCVTTSTINYDMEARLRACIQRVAFSMHNMKACLRACIQRAAFSMHKCSAKPLFEIEPNRDLVLRDEKVLPEVRNRPLLPRVFSAIQASKFFANPMGEPSVLHIKCPIYI